MPIIDALPNFSISHFFKKPKNKQNCQTVEATITNSQTKILDRIAANETSRQKDTTNQTAITAAIADDQQCLQNEEQSAHQTSEAASVMLNWQLLRRRYKT